MNEIEIRYSIKSAVLGHIEFDEVHFLVVEKEKLLDVEGAFIRALKPKCNSMKSARYFRPEHAEILKAFGCEHLIPTDPELRPRIVRTERLGFR